MLDILLKSGLRQAELARRCGVTKVFINGLVFSRYKLLPKFIANLEKVTGLKLYTEDYIELLRSYYRKG